MHPSTLVSGKCFLLHLLLLLLLPCVHPQLQGQARPYLDVGAFCGFEFTEGFR